MFNANRQRYKNNTMQNANVWYQSKQTLFCCYLHHPYFPSDGPSSWGSKKFFNIYFFNFHWHPAYRITTVWKISHVMNILYRVFVRSSGAFQESTGFPNEHDRWLFVLLYFPLKQPSENLMGKVWTNSSKNCLHQGQKHQNLSLSESGSLFNNIHYWAAAKSSFRKNRVVDWNVTVLHKNIKTG